MKLGNDCCPELLAHLPGELRFDHNTYLPGVCSDVWIFTKGVEIRGAIEMADKTESDDLELSDLTEAVDESDAPGTCILAHQTTVQV